MFGDVGHGTINAIVALLMIIAEKPLSKMHNDMIELIFMGRYLIFLQSCFSVLTGLIYNDFFALGFNCFGTAYEFAPGAKAGIYDAEYKKVYNFGIDPHWHWGDNSMIFLNSFKMKLSVVVGIS